jgi:hypothetical protein
MSKIVEWDQEDYFLAFNRYNFLKTLNTDQILNIIASADSGYGRDYDSNFDYFLDAMMKGDGL